MDLQATFYAVAITFISVWILFLLLVIVAGIFLFKRLTRMQTLFEQKIKSPGANILFALTPILPALWFVASKVLRRK